MLRRIIFILIITLVASTTSLAQIDRSEEINRLKNGLESASMTERTNTAKIIERSGLQDESLYLKVAQILKEGYLQATSPKSIDEMSWMCKALAASGDPNFRSLLDEVARRSPNQKLQKYASQSAALIDNYAARSKVLNSMEHWDDELTDEENRYVNMLRSDNLKLRRAAAKVIVRANNIHPKVFAEVAAVTKEMIEFYQRGILYDDTMAWLCKALATSGDKQYIPVLDTVVLLTAGEEGNATLRNHAKQARNSLL